MIARALRRRAAQPLLAPQAPAGRRVYAVGDVHGRADLLDLLLAKIDADGEGRTDKPFLVFVGDYIDRGRYSRQTIERLIGLSPDKYDLVFLRGNHEAEMLNFLERPELGARWLRIGGRETLESYKVPAPAYEATPAQMVEAAAALRAVLPAAHKAFLETLKMSAQLGDYVFVHAGLRPGRDLEKQTAEDMLEIREPFLNSKARFPFVVVHGHSPVENGFSDERRIAVDTGAYATGKLSAVRLEGAAVAFIEAT